MKSIRNGDGGIYKMLNIIQLQKAYQEFEFTSLRHAVSSGEKLRYLIREMREKAGFSGHLLCSFSAYAMLSHS